MKKNLLINVILIFACNAIFSQDLDWGNFEDDSTIWGDAWGGKAEVIDNPYKDGNPSNKVLRYIPDSSWQAISHWFEQGVLKPVHKTITMDVYADSATNLQLALLTPIIKDEVFIKDTIIPGEWRHIVFDISHVPVHYYQHIAFQTSEVTTLYFDNMVVHADSTEANDTIWTNFEVKNLVFGKVDDSLDFKANVRMHWDTTSIYLKINVIDDSIVNDGTSYQVDNIELYFDMDNSKRIHWPRNGAWMQNDTTFDKNDFQFRLVPGKLWTDETENKISGVYYHYMKDSLGYSFIVNIPWDSLMMDFMPATGKRIGFDVLISDNDAIANDKERNQITFNSPTTFPFNDPSLWGTLEFDSLGHFKEIKDTVVPSSPTNVTATGTNNNIQLSWNSSTDNTTVQYYIIKKGTELVDSVLAKKESNIYEIKNLQPGKYTYTVLASDLYSNLSAAGISNEVEIQKTSISEGSKEFVKVFPNPAANYINVEEPSGLRLDVLMYNTAGQLVLKSSVMGNWKLDVMALPKGLYTMKVIKINEVQYFKLILK